MGWQGVEGPAAMGHVWGVQVLAAASQEARSACKTLVVFQLP